MLPNRPNAPYHHIEWVSDLMSSDASLRIEWNTIKIKKNCTKKLQEKKEKDKCKQYIYSCSMMLSMMMKKWNKMKRTLT